MQHHMPDEAAMALREETARRSAELQDKRELLRQRKAATTVKDQDLYRRLTSAQAALVAEEAALRASQEAHDQKLADMCSLRSSLMAPTGEAGQKIQMLEALNSDILNTQKAISTTREERDKNTEELQGSMLALFEHQKGMSLVLEEREMVDRENLFYKRKMKELAAQVDAEGDTEEILLRNELKAKKAEIASFELRNEERAGEIAQAQGELAETQEAVRAMRNLQPIKIKPPKLPGATAATATRRKGAPREP